MNEAQRSEESGDEGANLTGLLCDIDKDDDGTWDLCDKYKGKWVDVCYALDGTFCGMHNNKRVTMQLPSRNIARQALIDWLIENT